MVASISQTFNREAIDPVDEEPILIGKRQHDGVTQYVVHEYKGFWMDDIEYYNEEDYQEKYGDNPPRTLDDLKSDLQTAMEQRYAVLKEAADYLLKKDNTTLIDRGMGGMDEMESKIASTIAVMHKRNNESLGYGRKISDLQPRVRLQRR
ncbi:MAG: hypothetical protein AAF282_05770 [Cyanobacteria bacterium P01_A01_bin.15]